MEKQTEILIVCKHDGIMATILRLINNNPAWHATGAADIAQVQELLKAQYYDLVLLGNGLSGVDESAIIAATKAKNSRTKIVQHYGGGSGLLFGEIHEALADK